MANGDRVKFETCGRSVEGVVVSVVQGRIKIQLDFASRMKTGIKFVTKTTGSGLVLIN